MREYLVSPALIIYRSNTDGLSEKARGKLPENASLSDVRYERVLDSAVAGVLAGGTLSGFLRTFPSHSFISAGGKLIRGRRKRDNPTSWIYSWNRHFAFAINGQSIPDRQITTTRSTISRFPTRTKPLDRLSAGLEVRYFPTILSRESDTHSADAGGRIENPARTDDQGFIDSPASQKSIRRGLPSAVDQETE